MELEALGKASLYGEGRFAVGSRVARGIEMGARAPMAPSCSLAGSFWHCREHSTEQRCSMKFHDRETENGRGGIGPSSESQGPGPRIGWPGRGLRGVLKQ